MNFKVNKTFLVLSIIAGLLTLSACGSLGYYTQSVVGHSSLMLSRQPVDQVIQNADESLKQRLETAMDIRQYAVDSMGLPDNNSYTSYVQLKQDTVVWNVIAAEEFSLNAKQWCYLVIGCASYRGYYHKEAAERYAQKMKQQGYDVIVAGATAYSTLGWFADPLTSAMFRRGDASLAELIFHELAHQQVYIKGDSRFNEAFASAVGELGAMQWLRDTGQKELLERYRQQLLVYNDFLNLINQTKASLQILYSSNLSTDDMRRKKAAIFIEMKQEYQRLKASKWDNQGWYDGWFNRSMNNARLVAVATYRDLVPGFIKLYEACGADFSRFYRVVRAIGKTEERNLVVSCEHF